MNWIQYLDNFCDLTNKYYYLLEDLNFGRFLFNYTLRKLIRLIGGKNFF